ncbi:MAG: hypothetical protein ACK5NA_09160 [Enterococcus sp.]
MKSYEQAKELTARINELKETMAQEITEKDLIDPMMKDLTEAGMTIRSIEKTLFILDKSGNIK